MTKRIAVFLILFILVLPACGVAAPEIASEPPPEPSPVQFVTATASPPTSTRTSLPPSPTATQVVVTEPSEIAQISEPEPTATQTETAVQEPTDIPTSTPEPDWLNNYGRTADNRVYLGNPSAPVTFIDFSDFM